MIEGYTFIYDESPPNGKPGGAGIFVKHGIQANVRHDLKLDCNFCENLWLETDVNGKMVEEFITEQPSSEFTVGDRLIEDFWFIFAEKFSTQKF